MFYILKSNKTYNKLPERSYAEGVTMQFKKGFFLVDTDNTKESYWESGDMLQLDGERFKIYEKISNKIKAEAYFLKRKLDEMDNNSFKFFMPDTYQIHLDRFNQINKDYPEHLI